MGICVCRGAPAINHLLFADDSLIFCKANDVTSNNLLMILNEYAQALGQCINMEKTTMVFSRNVKETDKTVIYAMWGYRGIKKYEKYLGLPPSLVAQRKRFFF